MGTEKGLTLAELMVTAGLTVLILGLSLQLFFPSLWLFKKGQAAAEAHQSALVVLNRISQELMETSPETVSLGETALSFVPVEGTSPSGRLLFNTKGFRVFAYEAGLRRLVHWTHQVPATGDPSKYPDTSDPNVPPVLDLQSALAADVRRSVLARHVEKFSLGEPGSTIHYPVRLAVTISVPQERAADSIQYETVSLETRIFPRCMRP